MKRREAIEILETALNAVNCDFSDYGGYGGIRDAVNALMDKCEEDNDFYLDDVLPSGEVRMIHEDFIDDIWSESLEELIKECYDLGNLPHFVEIDWDKTVDNCKVDGKGHHFAGYDHEEHHCNEWYIFRTN